MAKGNKATQAAAPAQATQAVQLYTCSTRYVGKPDTKHGKGGTAGTFAALVAAAQANGGTLTMAQARAVCVANGDPGFAAYAAGKLKALLPVQPA